ncbi:barstar family protein, partial [Bacillus paranthracis]
MDIIKLDGRTFTSKEVLHQILKKQLDFPSFYGENADALWD